MLVCKGSFLRTAHSTQQTPFKGVSAPGTRFSAESTEAMRIKCVAQGHNILMQPRFEPSIVVSRNLHDQYAGLNHWSVSLWYVTQRFDVTMTML